MYHVTTYVKMPKRKTAVTVVTSEGEIFDGFLFTSGDQRIKDLLNGESQFVPFETLSGAIQILNRDVIARVIERHAGDDALSDRRTDKEAEAQHSDAYLKV